MAIFKLLLPRMGESVSEATITNWVKQIGDRVEEDDAIVEIATDKVDSEVPSPVAGVLVERLFEVDQVVQVGDVIALIEIEREEDQPEQHIIANAVSTPIHTENIESEDLSESDQLDSDQPIPGIELVQDTQHVEDVFHPIDNSNSIRFYSPLVRNIARHEGISQKELDSIVGTGGEGRVTKEDVLNFIQKRLISETNVPHSDVVDPAHKEMQNSVEDSKKQENVIAGKSADDNEIIEMDRMRRLISDHMVNSVKTSPHVFSVVEADVTNMVNWRNSVKDGYKKREGENITFTPLIIEAIAKTIKDFPLINVSVDGYNIIRKKNINIGMAAALPSGNLIVPVIKNVDQLSLSGISKSVNDLANRARGNKLKPDDTNGGTFTFTNIGAFGNIIGMPIINQPQAAILAVGTIKKKPAVIETEFGDVIAIRHMMYLSMSYDHRVIDGALGGSFLKRVADYLENWDVNRVV